MKKNFLKTMILALVVLALGVITASAALAYGPYDGVNRIGTYYQHVSYGSYNYAYSGSYGGSVDYYGHKAWRTHGYNYPVAARTGGWFGTGSEFLIGLRPGTYLPFGPTNYPVRAHATCTWPNCYLGGNGYTIPAAQGGFYRTRIGGAYV